MDMFETELELTVGDTFQVGEYLVTVIDTDGEEISFRVDEVDTQNCDEEPEPPDLPPR